MITFKSDYTIICSRISRVKCPLSAILSGLTAKIAFLLAIFAALPAVTAFLSAIFVVLSAFIALLSAIFTILSAILPRLSANTSLLSIHSAKATTSQIRTEQSLWQQLRLMIRLVQRLE